MRPAERRAFLAPIPSRPWTQRSWSRTTLGRATAGPLRDRRRDLDATRDTERSPPCRRRLQGFAAYAPEDVLTCRSHRSRLSGDRLRPGRDARGAVSDRAPAEGEREPRESEDGPH